MSRTQYNGIVIDGVLVETRMTDLSKTEAHYVETVKGKIYLNIGDWIVEKEGKYWVTPDFFVYKSTIDEAMTAYNTDLVKNGEIK